MYFPLVRKYFCLDAIHNRLLRFFDLALVAFVKRPLLDASCPHARSAFGITLIPLGACAEIELIAEVF
jgi:hypothetical protein